MRTSRLHRVRPTNRKGATFPAVISADSPGISVVVAIFSVFYSPDKMSVTSSTLKPGDRAPEFTLSAANREGSFALTELRTRGTVILEFLRGTW